MFGPKKGHFIIVFDNVASIIVPAILLGIVIARTGFQIEQLAEVIPIIIILILTPVMKLMAYLFTTYQVTEEMMVVRKGLVNKKEIQIPLETITTIDLSQNVIFQLAKVYKIRIETTVQYAGEKDKNTILALKGDSAIQFKTMLLKLKEEIILGNSREGQSEDSLRSNNKLSSAQQELDSGTVEERAQSFSDRMKDGAYCNDESGNAAHCQGESLGVSVRPTIGEFILYAALKSKLIGMIILISGIFSLGPTLGTIVLGENSNSFVASIAELGFERVAEAIENIGQLGTILIMLISVGVVLITIIIGYLLATIVTIAATLIKFLGFNVCREKDKVYINYGLLTKKSFTLTENKISGIELSQSLLMRIFRVYTVSVYAIGYGGTEGESGASSGIGMIYPLAKKEKIQEIMGELFPEIVAEEPYQREKQGTLRYFFYSPSIFFGAAFVVAATISGNIFSLGIYHYLLIAIFSVIMILLVISSILKYHNCKLSLGEKTISYIKGGFKKDIVFLKRDLIETVGFGTTVLKERKGFGNLIIQFYGPMGFNEQKVVNQNLDDYSRIKQTIMY